jgi:hypothetical protein
VRLFFYAFFTLVYYYYYFILKLVKIIIIYRSYRSIYSNTLPIFLHIYPIRNPNASIKFKAVWLGKVIPK